MPSLLVAYDLVGTGESSQNYEPLIARIREYPNWARIQRSVWVLITEETAQAVRDDLWRFMQPSDRLFVIRLQREAAWFNAMCKDDWLQANL